MQFNWNKIEKVFKALSSKTRLQILYESLIAPKCGRDLASIYKKDTSTISRHIKELINANLIEIERRKKEVCVIVKKKKLVKKLLEIAEMI